MGLLAFFILCIIVINIAQKYFPSWLPKVLRTWEFMPLFMRSLKPYDEILMKIRCCKARMIAPEVKEEIQLSEKIAKDSLSFCSIILWTYIY
jgi:hypothetical protein